jgi:hypothetical protein
MPEGTAVGISTLVGDNLFPAVITTAYELANNRYVANYDVNKLFPKGLFTSPHVPLYDQLNMAVNRITTIGSIPHTDYFTALINGTRRAMTAIHEQRLIDMSELLPTLTNYFGYTPTMWNPPPTAIDGTIYNAVNVAATEAQHPGFAQAYGNFWQMIGHISSEEPTWGQFVIHNMAVQATQDLDSRVHNPALSAKQQVL